MKIKFIGKAKLTTQGQITLPFEARDDLGIKLDSEVYWYEVDDYLVATKELLNPEDLKTKLKRNAK